MIKFPSSALFFVCSLALFNISQANDAAVPENVLNRLDSPLLQPKFKKLSYIYTPTIDNSKNTPVTVEFTSDGGLLKKNEIYSEDFHVERLTQADLIQLKAKVHNMGNEYLFITKELEVNAPESWSPGQILSIRLVMEKLPAGSTDKPMKNSNTCTVGQRFPAREIFASLTGDAIALECEQDNIKTSNAFVEDLGVALTLKKTLGKRESVHTYTAIDVVR
ncbi:hypothetical protein OH710_02740 [Pseudomonas capsici]|uniref:hypothetical protein n=1 Tax=Pseudomonas capsici TaxID=2810614 RepID=UPI0019106E2B|nr:hypothetical protein [Pseudomonas capsici]MBX8612692.1 hypothetical protein [Pseudomonas cichorii]MCV4271547.1 hypothetical protein [Pseudomonas capsici]GFM69513.1 hypothetical protein PSCICL_05050 [Pseudomonas cichorii]